MKLGQFLESWGLHFDTPDGGPTTIPYPQVFIRMINDARPLGGDKLVDLVKESLNTIDGETFIRLVKWSSRLDIEI